MLMFQPLQLMWWNFAFKKLVASPNQTVPEYQRIAAEEAAAFLETEAIEPFLRK